MSRGCTLIRSLYRLPIDSERLCHLGSRPAILTRDRHKGARGAALHQPASGCHLSHSPIIALQKNGPDCTLLTILPTGRGTAKGIYESDSVNTAES
jgi:hypothetical protein